MAFVVVPIIISAVTGALQKDGDQIVEATLRPALTF